MGIFFKLALRPWKAAPLSQFVAATVVGFLVLLSGFLFWLERGLEPVVRRLQQEQVVTAWVAAGSAKGAATGTAAEEQVLVEKVQAALTAAGERASRFQVRFHNGAEFLEQLRGSYPDLVRTVEDLGPEGAHVVPRFVTVTGMLSNGALDVVKRVEGIEGAETSRDRYVHIVGAYQALRWMTRVLALGLSLALLTGLVHLARMNSLLLQDAVGVLRLWGASGAILRMPGLIAGASVGLLGGVLAVVGWSAGAETLVETLRALSPQLRDLADPGGSSMAAILAACGSGIGILAGWAGSILPAATARHAGGAAVRE